MKKRALLLCALIFAIVPASAATSNFSTKNLKTQPVVLEKPSGEYVVGERLYYEVSWMGVNIGYGEIEMKEMTVINGREAYHVVAVARTNEFLSKLYPVRDEAHSWIDAKTFHSLKFRKVLSEGRYRADEQVEFFPEQKKGRYRSNKNGTEKDFDIPGDVHDILSAFCWFRLQDARPGLPVKTIVNSEEKNWDLEVKPLGLETKEIRGLGPVGTLRVEPVTRLKGILYDRGRAWVYFTADRSRRPVWFRLQTPYGPVNAVIDAKASKLTQSPPL